MSKIKSKWIDLSDNFVFDGNVEVPTPTGPQNAVNRAYIDYVAGSQFGSFKASELVYTDTANKIIEIPIELDVSTSDLRDDIVIIPIGGAVLDYGIDYTIRSQGSVVYICLATDSTPPTGVFDGGDGSNPSTDTYLLASDVVKVMYPDGILPMGFQGAEGAGFQGPTGFQGYDLGLDGPQGFSGVQGFTGAGVQGATGSIGSTGVQGFTGTTGLQGFTGAGVQGATGSSGVQGTSGSNGFQGVQGTNGSPLLGPSTIFLLGSATTITNNATETSMLSSGVGSLTIPANAFYTGKTLKFTIFGNMLNQITIQVISFRIKLGSNTFLTMTSQNGGTAINATSTTFWRMDGELKCNTTGGSGAFVLNAVGLFPLTNSTWQTVYGYNNSLSFDTTTSQAIDFTVENAATSSQSIRVDFAHFQLLG